MGMSQLPRRSTMHVTRIQELKPIRIHQHIALLRPLLVVLLPILVHPGVNVTGRKAERVAVDTMEDAVRTIPMDFLGSYYSQRPLSWICISGVFLYFSFFSGLSGISTQSFPLFLRRHGTRP